MMCLRIAASLLLVSVASAACRSRPAAPVRVEQSDARGLAVAFLEAHGDVRVWDITKSTVEGACEIDCAWVVFIPKADGAGTIWIAVFDDRSCRQIGPQGDAFSTTPWIAYDPTILFVDGGVPLVPHAN